ncbi:MAG: ABC transporter ATP-binding protein [Acetatifactor sp.]
MTEFAIKTKELRKEYFLGDACIVAVNGINMEIEANTSVSIMGTSGSGKTTLLNLLGGIDKPTGGEVILSGINITQMKEAELASFRRDNIGYVFQKFYLIPEMSVEENIAFPALLKGKHLDREYFLFLCERLGIANRLRHIPSELSGGQQQRVAIARALINKPQVLFCDEPTGNLDKKTSKEVIHLLISLQHELCNTLVIVTHDTEIATVSDKLYVMEDGVLYRDLR